MALLATSTWNLDSASGEWVHESGLRVFKHPVNGPSILFKSLHNFQVHELANGCAIEDLPMRLRKLFRQAKLILR